MTRHIVVGYSGVANGGDALALALTLQAADPEDSVEVTVAVVHPHDPRNARFRTIRPDDEPLLAVEAENRVDEARATCGDRPRVSFVVRGAPSPAHGLHELAQERGAELLVVGRSHTGPVGRVFTGSVTEQTLQGAPCAVAIAPTGYADARHEVATIGVAVDESAESERAVEVAVRLASRCGARLRLTHVLTPLPTPYGGYVAPYPLPERREDADVVLDRLRARLHVQDAETRVLVGEPAKALAAAEQAVDLLVVGSRSFGPVSRVLLGSVSSHLARHCPFPLLVVPRTAHVMASPPVTASSVIAD